MQEVHAYENDMPLDSLNAALQQLACLTGLALNMECEAFPSALTGLSKLQWLYLSSRGCDATLPAGAWVSSLRRLALEPEAAQRITSQLAAATWLSHLSLLEAPTKGESLQLLADWAAFWTLVATHPPLRCLDIRDEDVDHEHCGMVSVDLFEAGMQLAIERPHLNVAVTEYKWDWPLEELRCMASADDE